MASLRLRSEEQVPRVYHCHSEARAGELQSPRGAVTASLASLARAKLAPAKLDLARPRERPQRQASAELCECECEMSRVRAAAQLQVWPGPQRPGPARRRTPGGTDLEDVRGPSRESLLMRTEATARGIMLPGVRVTRVSESGPGRSGLRAARPYRDTWSLQSSRAHHSLRSDSPLPHPPTALTVARSPPPPPAGPLLRAGRRHAQAGPARNGRPSGGRGLEGKGGRWGCQR